MAAKSYAINIITDDLGEHLRTPREGVTLLAMKIARRPSELSYPEATPTIGEPLPFFLLHRLDLATLCSCTALSLSQLCQSDPTASSPLDADHGILPILDRRRRSSPTASSTMRLRRVTADEFRQRKPSSVITRRLWRCTGQVLQDHLGRRLRQAPWTPAVPRYIPTTTLTGVKVHRYVTNRDQCRRKDQGEIPYLSFFLVVTDVGSCFFLVCCASIGGKKKMNGSGPT